MVYLIDLRERSCTPTMKTVFKEDIIISGI